MQIAVDHASPSHCAPFSRPLILNVFGPHEESRLSWVGSAPTRPGSSTSAWAKQSFLKSALAFSVMSSLGSTRRRHSAGASATGVRYKKGRAASGAPAARGLGRCSEGSLQLKLPRPVRAADETQEENHDAYRDADCYFHRYSSWFLAASTTRSSCVLGSPASMERESHSHRYSRTGCRITTRRGRGYFRAHR